MSITVTPTHADFVTEISGVDLARPLKPADRDAIEEAINRYAIVVFHDQKLTDEQQIDFARHFGPINSSAQKARHTGIKHRIASHDISSAQHSSAVEALEPPPGVLLIGMPRSVAALSSRLLARAPVRTMNLRLGSFSISARGKAVRSRSRPSMSNGASFFAASSTEANGS